jgi:hypothetical protein
MSNPAVPNPDDVQRGREIVCRELDRSLIMPRPAQTIRAILRLIDSAHTVLSQQIEGQDPYTQAAGVAVGLVDGCRRELAVLGGDR